MAAGHRHTLLLRDDGVVNAFGSNEHGQCDVPALPKFQGYVAVAAGNSHSLLVRDDGEAFAFGGQRRGGVRAFRA